MYLIEILLPLYDNDRQPFSRDWFDGVRDELTNRFGGVTAFRRAPAEGAWREGAGISYDEVVIYEVMAPELERDWWQVYRQGLEQRFRQEEIVIRASKIECI